jgi:hypothetical protein
MVINDFPSAQDVRPVAREKLAAAGPVEPSSSPGRAPGPTFSQSAKYSGEHFRRRRTPALVGEVRRLYREGENYSGIARAIAVTRDTARRWLDPDYDLHRSRHAATAVLRPEGEGDVPTLAFIPGIVITGRYRMRTPS